MNWLNPTTEDILKQAELESEFPIAAGHLVPMPTQHKTKVQVALQRDKTALAVRPSGKRVPRTRTKQNVA